MNYVQVINYSKRSIIDCIMARNLKRSCFTNIPSCNYTIWRSTENRTSHTRVTHNQFSTKQLTTSRTSSFMAAVCAADAYIDSQFQFKCNVHISFVLSFADEKKAKHIDDCWMRLWLDLMQKGISLYWLVLCTILLHNA